MLWLLSLASISLVVAVVLVAPVAVVVKMATFDELIKALETSHDDESVFDAPLEDGHPSFATESEELAHTAMVNYMQVTAQNDKNMV